MTDRGKCGLNVRSSTEYTRDNRPVLRRCKRVATHVLVRVIDHPHGAYESRLPLCSVCAENVPGAVPVSEEG